MKPETLQIARDVFAAIGARFPWMQMTEDHEVSVELSVTIPVQPGIKQEVWLSLQNDDDLHFSVAHLWLEWFPCTDSKRVDDYLEAVCGFIAGESRVLEHYRGNRCVKAQLQVAGRDNWKTIGTWARPSVPLPWRVTFREVRNA